MYCTSFCCYNLWVEDPNFILHNYLLIALFGPKYCTLQLVFWQFNFHSSSSHMCPMKVRALSKMWN